MARASILKSLTAASIGSFGGSTTSPFWFLGDDIAKHFFPSSDPTAGILSTFADYAPKGMRHNQSLFSRPRAILQPRKIT